MSVQGKYIVLEGPEGVGKTTQLQELARRMRAAGLAVRTLREPDSQSDLTARAIRQLTQDPQYPMNTRTEVLLYNAARSQSLEAIRNSIEHGVHCLVDRNYLTTLAIQFYGRGDVPDYYTINNIINFAVGGLEPDLTIILDAPVQTLKERAKDRLNKERFDNLDDAFLERVRAGYLWEAKQRGYPLVYASDSVEQVADAIWQLASKALATRSSASATAGPASLKQIIDNKTTNSPASAGDEPLVNKLKNGSYKITEAGEAWLDDAVTNVRGNVYATLHKLESVTAAAAMARLSRRGDDMRVTILDEFAGEAEKDEQLLHRVITAYGDDSVQQLVGQHIVVENASNLLTKKLEWGRLAAYLEQSTRYIYFDQKDEHGHYKYYLPPEFKAPTLKKYTRAMDQIFDLYSEMVRELTEYIREHDKTPKKQQDGPWRSATKAQACDAVRSVLPVATRATVGIFASGQALESLIMHLLADELPEARTVGQQILEEARKVIPIFLERADKPERGGAMIAYRANTYKQVQKLADKYLPPSHTSVVQSGAELVDYSPRNELDIVADILYEHSDESLENLKKLVANWGYAKKVKMLKTYCGERLNRRHRPGRALEKIHYSWDIVCDYGIFRDLQRHRMVDDLEYQALTPRYGYDIPKIVEDAGLADKFEQCFDISLKLYSQLQAADYPLQAQYATLLGHRMRWKVTYNAREAFHFHELRTSPQGHPGYRKLVKSMHDQVASVHPLLAEAMRFVNRDEDPELTRLAAERAAAYKLAKLDNQKAG